MTASELRASVVGAPLPISLVCPRCHQPFDQSDQGLLCSCCATVFRYRSGFPELIVGERFEDDKNEALLCYEEEANANTTRNFWIPLFRRLWSDDTRAARILSVGCGTGVDIDLLTAEGYDCVGIDCGNRTDVWPRRRNPERLLLANGKNLPFEEGAYDFAFCGCVFPHVGVKGDSSEVTQTYREERLALAKEMTRVLKPGGKVIVSSPNRNCPFDIFHGRDNGSYRPQINYPNKPFLLSISDYERLFGEAGCGSARALPAEKYWGFVKSRRSLKGRILALPVRFVIWLTSRSWMAFLRGSPLSPWIVVLLEKEEWK